MGSTIDFLARVHADSVLDENLDDKIKYSMEGSIDLKSTGTYTVDYRVTDSAGRTITLPLPVEIYNPVEALKKAKVPVIFFHGEADSLVPCHMSRTCYEACASRKKLVTVPGAEHGLSYPTDPETYLAALREFFGPEGSYQEQKTNP